MTARKFARRKVAGRIGKLSLAMALCASLTIGCRTPPWCAKRPLNCLPQGADCSAPGFWQQCCSSPDVDCRDQAPPTEHHSSRQTQAGASQSGFAASVERDVHADAPIANDPPSIRPAQAGMHRTPAIPAAWQQVQIDQEAGVKQRHVDLFQLPSVLPGADTPPLRIPKASDSTEKDPASPDREQFLRELYPQLTSPTSPSSALGEPQVASMGLEQLQEMARDFNPTIRAEAAAVEVARGKMIQAGLPPNPQVGYQADTVRTLFTDGYQGAYLQQTFITARKLGLAAEAAAVDHANAYLALRKSWYTVVSEVRRQYFNTLAARKRLELAEALWKLTEQSYRSQVELVKVGEAAAYEPLQLRVLTTQAKATVVQAQQDSIAAWRALAATVGVVNLEPAKLEGRIDCPVPQIEYEIAVDRLMAVHTDIQSARNLIGKNRTLVALADRQPIPNLDLGVVVQNDDTFTPGTTTYNLLLGGALPVFDRNQGNRVAARADLVKASETAQSISNQLVAQLAPAYATYQTNRLMAASFRTEALQDQVRSYRGIYQRYHTDPAGIGFNDIVVAQQTLASTLNQYLQILQSQWLGLVNVGELLQVDDIFALGPTADVAQIPVIGD